LLVAAETVVAEEPAERFQKIAQRLVQAINDQDYSAIRDDLSQEMLDAVPTEKSKEFFTKVVTDFGKIEKLDSPRLVPPNGAVIAAYCVQRELEIRILLNEHNKIAGLSLRPPAIPVPNKPVTSFRLPFEGQWLVLWGGDSRALSGHHYDSPHQRFAFDFVVVDPSGRTHQGDGKDNTDYYAFGLPILAPADGVVTDVITGVRDNTPGSINTAFAGGNAVILQHREHEVSVLAHLQHGSIRVTCGQRVKRGQVLGLCGNSGTSSEPHLHFHVQNTPIFQDATGLRCLFDHLTVTRDGKTESMTDYSPVKGDLVRPQ
jgi:murein DD-endopeptidase MepM/ murein hydrolase activator NlpD